MLLGDVLVIVASIAALGVSTWALFVGAAFLFDVRTTRAKAALSASPGRCFWLGLLAALVLTILSIRILTVPFPLVRILGLLVLTGLFALVGVGGGGLARLLASRIQGEDHSVTRLPAIVRSSLYIVLISGMPVLGTLIVTPIVIATCTGAGLQALFSRAPSEVGSEA